MEKLNVAVADDNERSSKKIRIWNWLAKPIMEKKSVIL